MAILTGTTGDVEQLCGLLIADAKLAGEHNAPCKHLITEVRLAKGQQTYRYTKLGQMTAYHIAAGLDFTNEQALGEASINMTTARSAVRFVLDRTIITQFAAGNLFTETGEQAGRALSRLEDTDIIALFSALNSGTVLGGDNYNFIVSNAVACITQAKAGKYEPPVCIVHHPYATSAASRQLAGTMATYPMAEGPNAEFLKRFYEFKLGDVEIYQDGNIEKISGYDSGYGAIFAKRALGVVREHEGYVQKREEDISRDGTEVVVNNYYGVYELWDLEGAPLQYEIGAPSTTN